MTKRRLLVAAIALPLALYLAAVGYVRWTGPPEAVIAGNAIPDHIAARMRELGRFADGEQARWFYSDSVLDISDGFCFVSNRRVGAFVEGKLVAYPLADVADAVLSEKTEPLVDASLTIRTRGGEYLRLHLAQVGDGHERFREAVLGQ